MMGFDNGFLKEINSGKMRIMKVGIIDDNSDILKSLISNQVYCEVVEYSLEKIMKYSNDELKRSLLLGYDILFWDASLVDDEGISVLTILEKLIQINSQFASKSRVMIGQDIIHSVQSSDFEVRLLIERAQRLPHIIYGKEFGTKADNMLNYMKREASSKNIALPDRLPDGICRKEILDKVKPYIDSISQYLKEQSILASGIYEDFKDFQPTSEEERMLLETVYKMASLFSYQYHSIVTLYEVMHNLFFRNTEKQHKNIQKKNEEEYHRNDKEGNDKMKLKMFTNKFGRVFFIDEKGNRFNKVGYCWSSDFFSDGVACVVFKKNGFSRKKYLRDNGTFISDECFIKGEDGFTFGSVKVMRENGEWCYLDYDGKFHTRKP